jgi:hypothetical protein
MANSGSRREATTGAVLVAAHRGEPRWAMAGTVLVAAGLHATLPAELRIIGQAWVYPSIVGVMLLVLIAGDPGRIDKTDPWLRVVTGLLIGFITLVNAVSTGSLVRLILTDSDRSMGGPIRLLTAGAAIWIINVLAFGLWFWDLDQGGAAERAAGTTRLPALLFPEMANPDVVRAGWAPTLPDYLHMSWGSATSLGPSDVSAIKLWSKAMMTFEAGVSLLLGVLIVARAINLLP